MVGLRLMVETARCQGRFRVEFVRNCVHQFTDHALKIRIVLASVFVDRAGCSQFVLLVG